MTPWKAPLSVGALACLLLAGCAFRTATLDTVAGDDAVEVRLDANARVHHSNRQLKFFVDLINRSDSQVQLNELRIELRAHPAADAQTISLRKQWTYGGMHWERGIFLRPGAKATVPIVPERNVEFPLEILDAGPYQIVAIVNDRFRTAPYQLTIVRPDLRPEPIPLESLRRLLGNGR